MPPQFDDLGIALRLFPLLPCEDLVDLVQYEERSLAIELRWHRRVPSKQARQANQGLLLLNAAPEWILRDPVFPDKDQHTDSCCKGFGESGCHCAAESPPTRFAGSYPPPGGQTPHVVHR